MAIEEQVEIYVLSPQRDLCSKKMNTSKEYRTQPTNPFPL